MADKSPSLSTLASVIKQGISEAIKDLHTSIPGIVQSFDPVTQTASVQPAIKRVFKTREKDLEILTPSDLPILINVPVTFPRGGGFSLTFPVVKGDECLLVFCERSIDLWHKSGGVKEPGARRFHSLSDATAYVGLSSLPNKVPSYDPVNVQLKKDDGSAEVNINADGTVSVNANTAVNITAPTTTINGDLVVTGDTQLAANVTSNGTDISDTHTHTQGPDSAGNTQQNTGTPV